MHHGKEPHLLHQVFLAFLSHFALLLGSAHAVGCHKVIIPVAASACLKNLQKQPKLFKPPDRGRRSITGLGAQQH